MEDLTAKEITRLSGITRHTKTMAFGTKVQDIIDAINLGTGPVGPAGPAGAAGADGAAGPQGEPGPCTVVPTGTPVNAISGTATLDITGVVLDGETVTINGADIYEFAADAALSVIAGNIPVDINSATSKSTNGLTVDTNPTIGNTMTIGTKVFIFVPLGTANGDGEIDVEVALADTQVNIIAAIMGTDHNDPHPLVKCDEAFLNDVLAITALVGGVAGNLIATTETFTAETNIFSAQTLGNGSDCVAADAVIALALAITTFDTQGVGAVDGAGNTVVLTADIGGVITNSITVAENMANAAFVGAVTALAGGADGTVGDARSILMDETYLYLCYNENTIADKNWRRIALGQAY